MHYHEVGFSDPNERLVALDAAGVSVQQVPCNLTDDQIYDAWLFRDCMDAIRAGDMRGQFISAVRAIERHLAGDTNGR